MAKNLGIKVRLDYPTVSEIEKEIQGLLEKANGKIRVEIDENSISKMTDAIRQTTKNEPVKINININDAIEQLNKINSELQNLRKVIEDTDVSSLKRVSKAVNEVGDAVDRTSKKQKESVEETAKTQNQQLREMAKIEKEINNLYVKAYNSSGSELEAYERRIDYLKKNLDQLKSDYSKDYGSPDSSEILRSQQAMNAYNAELKQAKADSKALNDDVREYTRLLNEELRINKQIDNATGSGHSRALEKQLALNKQLQDEVRKRANFEENLTQEQKNSLNLLEQQNRIELEVTRAKERSKEVSQEQKQTYRELQTDLKEIHKLEMKIAELQALKNADVQTPKQEEDLRIAKETLKIRREIYNQDVKDKSNAGELTKDYRESLNALDKQHSSKVKIKEATSKITAEVRKEREGYEEIERSIKRIEELNKALKKADGGKALAIRKEIDAEMSKQKVLIKSLESHEKNNSARDRGILKTQQEQREQSELNELIGDTSKGLSSRIVANIDLISLARQATMYVRQIHTEILELDKVIVDVEKVANATDSMMADFRANIYDMASEVGVQAENFASAVERWAIQGYQLPEAIERAKVSTIGAFVGNIDESTMVDYLAVAGSAWREFGENIEDSYHIINLMNEVSNENAVTMDDLGKAYQRAGQTAAMSNTSLEEFTGLIVGANDATRMGGDVIGTALRNINMNFAEMSAGLTKTATNKKNFFTEIGVDINDSNGELRSTYDILGDLSRVWGDLSSEQKNTASMYGALKRHAPVLQALVGNWESVEKATREANEQTSLYDPTTGSGMKEFEVQTNSVEYATSNLVNTWKEFINTASGGRETMIKLLNGAESAISLINDVTASNSGLKEFVLWFGKLGIASIAINNGMGKLKVGFDLMKISASGATDSMKAIYGLALEDTFRTLGTQSLTSAKAIGHFSKTAWGLIPTLGKVAIALGGVDIAIRLLTGGSESLSSVIKDMGQVFSDSLRGISITQRALMDLGEKQNTLLKNFYESSFMTSGAKKMQNDFDEIKKSMNLTEVLELNYEGLQKFEVKAGESVGKLAERIGVSGLSLSKALKDAGVQLNEASNEIMISSDANVDLRNVQLNPEAFSQLQSKINSYIVEHGLEEYDISLNVNAISEINYVMRQIDRAKGQEVKKQIVESATELDTLVQETMDVISEKLPAIEYKGELEAQGYIDSLGKITEEGKKAIRTFNESNLSSGDFFGIFNNPIGNSDAINALRQYNSMTEEELQQLEQIYQNTSDAVVNMIDRIHGGFSGINIGELIDEFGGVDKYLESSAFTSFLGAGFRIEKDRKLVDDFIGMLEEIEKAGNNTQGVLTEIPEDMHRELARIFPEIGQMSRNLLDESWKDFDKNILEKSKKDSEKWINDLATTFYDADLGGKWREIEKEFVDKNGNITMSYELISEAVRALGQDLDVVDIASVFDISMSSAEEYKNNLDGLGKKIDEYTEKLNTLPEEKITNYQLKTEAGTIDMDFIRLIENVPSEVQTRFNLIDDDGNVNIQQATDFIQKLIDAEGGQEFLARVGAYQDGEFDFEKFANFFNGNDKQGVVELLIQSNAIEVSDAIGLLDGEIKNTISEGYNANIKFAYQLNQDGTDEERIKDLINGKSQELSEMFNIEANLKDEKLKEDAINIRAVLQQLAGEEVDPSVDLNSQKFKEEKDRVMYALGLMDKEEIQSKYNMKIDDFLKNSAIVEQFIEDNQELDSLIELLAKTDKADKDIEKTKKEAKKDEKFSVGADTNPAKGAVDDLVNSINSKKANVKVGISTSIGAKVSSLLGKISGSTSIEHSMSPINTGLGTSFSAGIGSTQKNTRFSRGSSKTKSNNSRVNSDVWRYWSHELYRGMPLENTMKSLERSMDKNSDSTQQLINVTKQQNSHLTKQRAYQQQLLKLQQREMNSILSQLRKYGFKTSGNKISNLGRAQSLRGESAEKADKLLSEYNSLYNAMNSTRQEINNINHNIWKNTQEIKELEVKKELERLERYLVQTHAVLTSIKNDMSLTNTKLSLIDNNDSLLNMTVTNEALHRSAQNTDKLISEFNRMSTTTMKNKENAEKLASELETLRSEILSNADAVIKYQEELNNIKIDRLRNVYADFNQAITRNINLIDKNIDVLQKGFLSGEKFADSYSSTLSSLNLDTRTEYQKQYQERIELEAKLNKIMEEFDLMQIQRKKKMANAELLIRKQKYDKILKIESGMEVKDIKLPGISTGQFKTESNSDAWEKELQKQVSEYQKAYDKIVKTYDKLINKQVSAQEVERLNQNMVIDQLGIQEEMYRRIISMNNDMIKDSEEMLKLSTLTTTQRKELEKQIEQYKDSNISAQESIRKIVEDRLNLELNMISQVVDKANEITTAYSDMLKLVEATTNDPNKKATLSNKIYSSLINEYNSAVSVLEEYEKKLGTYDAGSLQYNLVKEQIEEVRKTINDLRIDMAKANEDFLKTQVEIIKDANEQALLGMPKDDYESRQRDWVRGIEKEIELEKLRADIADIESQNLQKLVEALDRQEEISKIELEYTQKLIESQQLREKINNLSGERTVQRLSYDGSGNWEWGYYADESEISKAQDDLNKLEIEIEKMRESEMSNYIGDMNKIASNIMGGEYSTLEELREAIVKTQSKYSGVLGNSVYDYDTSGLIDAYGKYLEDREGILDSGLEMAETSPLATSINDTLITVAPNMGKIIGEEIANILRSVDGFGDNSQFSVETLNVDFPNITSPDGIAEAFMDLPNRISQLVTEKA